jgi:hypothetical protein
MHTRVCRVCRPSPRRSRRLHSDADTVYACASVCTCARGLCIPYVDTREVGHTREGASCLAPASRAIDFSYCNMQYPGNISPRAYTRGHLLASAEGCAHVCKCTRVQPCNAVRYACTRIRLSKRSPVCVRTHSCKRACVRILVIIIRCAVYFAVDQFISFARGPAPQADLKPAEPAAIRPTARLTARPRHAAVNAARPCVACLRPRPFVRACVRACPGTLMNMIGER